MQFRVGLNLGDVIVEGDNLYGDGVNVAALEDVTIMPGGRLGATAAVRASFFGATLGLNVVDAAALEEAKGPGVKVKVVDENESYAALVGSAGY